MVSSDFEIIANPIVFSLTDVDKYELDLSAFEIYVLKDIVKFV